MKTYDVAVDDVSGPADGAASGATSSDDAQSDRVTAQSTQISYHGTRLTNPARHVIIHAASHRCSLFYHIARLSEAVPANQVLRCHVDASLGRPLITDGNVDQAGRATTGWSTSVRTPAFLQLICGAGQSDVDAELCATVHVKLWIEGSWSVTKWTLNGAAVAVIDDDAGSRWWHIWCYAVTSSIFGHTADNFASFFGRKVDDVGTSTAGKPTPPVFDSASTSLSSFRECSTSEVPRIVMSSSIRYCTSDPENVLICYCRTLQQWSTLHRGKHDCRILSIMRLSLTPLLKTHPGRTHPIRPISG